MPRAKKVVHEDLVEKEVEEVKNNESFDVVSANGEFIRTYSVEIHGDNAEGLANEFANKVRGKVK